MPTELNLSGMRPTSKEYPDYPSLKFESNHTVVQEAFINGQYLGAHLSAMGCPRPKWWIWRDFMGQPGAERPLGAPNDRPSRTRQHAFYLEADGQLLADHWQWNCDLTAPDGTRTVLDHELRPVRATVHTHVDDTGFIVRHLEVTNTGADVCALSRVFPWSGLIWEVGARRLPDDVPIRSLPTSAFSIGRMTDSEHLTEGAFDWVALPAGTYGFESLHGRSGAGMPFFMLRNNVTGEMFIADFGWSGNWTIELYNDYEPAGGPRAAARVYAKIGLAGPPPLRLLQPGESAATPAVHFGLVFGDLDEAVQALHRHIRTSVVPAQPKGREHLVEVNHTAFTGNQQVTEEQLYDEIDQAAAVGAELFVLDAGWFGGATTPWITSVGDWSNESPVLTHGVKAALDRAREHGMLAGLWVEPERMGSLSQLLLDHPDWQMSRRNAKIPNLDLTQPEVLGYFEHTICEIIERYELDCFRLDYNQDIGEGGERVASSYAENVLWRHYDQLYGVFDRVRARYPQLLLENCSSGGGRMDLGMLSRFHWTQVTDMCSPGPTLRIFNGVTIALPPELCESMVGGISEGVADIDFLIRVGLFGHFNICGMYPNMAERNAPTLARWQHGVNIYKTFCRPMLSSSLLFHHTPIQSQMKAGEWVVLEAADPGRSRAYIGVFRLPGATTDFYHLIPNGLDPALRYRVVHDSWGVNYEIDGATICNDGLRVRVPSPLRSELLLVTSC